MRGMPIEFHKELVFGVEEDFIHGSFASGVALGNGFTPTHAVGTIAVVDADAPAGLGGQMVLTTSGADDEFCSYLTTFEMFSYRMGHPIRFIAKRICEAAADENLDTLNIFIGCMENMDTATEIQDAGAGMRVLGGDGFGFFKPSDGVLEEDTWYCWSSFNDVAQFTLLDPATAANLSRINWPAYGATTIGIPYDMEAIWMPTNLIPGAAGAAPTGLDAEIHFKIGPAGGDRQLVCKHVQNAANLITIATVQEMNFGLVVRANAAEAQVLRLDYMKCEQLR